LLGDGAGVALIEPAVNPSLGLVDHLFRVDPTGERECVIPTCSVVRG
jgi:hypothetical protein